MGLDQYAYKVRAGEQLEYTQREHIVEIAYWRKHNRLQGWMENRWIEKGRPNPQINEDGTPREDFNCVNMELSWEDIIALTESIDNRTLPETGGDFFGADSYDWKKSNGDYEDLQHDLEFIEMAKLVLDTGDKVVYSSWY